MLNSEPFGGLVRQDSLDHPHRVLGRVRVVEVLGQLERDGHAGDLEERPLDRRRHGSRVKDVDPRVRARVDPRDDQVGRPGHQLADRQLDAVGRAPLDHPAQGRAVVVVDLLDDQGVEQRDRVPHAALLHGRGDHGHRPPAAAAPCARLGARGQTRRRRWSARSARWMHRTKREQGTHAGSSPRDASRSLPARAVRTRSYGNRWTRVNRPDQRPVPGETWTDRVPARGGSTARGRARRLSSPAAPCAAP